MSRTSPSNLAFITLAGIIVIASATGLALLWPSALSAARWQAGQLVREAQAHPEESLADFTLAAHLDPHNQAAQFGLAKAQLAAGQPGPALDHLDRAGKDREVRRLRIRILIELGQAVEAAPTAQALVHEPNPTASDITLAGLCYALAGRTADLPDLEALPSPPETARSLKRATAGQIPLAAELLASGLPESSRTLLVAQPPSFERNLMLAQIAYAQATTDQLKIATDYLTTAIVLNPSSLEAHQLLEQTYKLRGLNAEAAIQSSQIQRLKTGQ